MLDGFPQSESQSRILERLLTGRHPPCTPSLAGITLYSPPPTHEHHPALSPPLTGTTLQIALHRPKHTKLHRVPRTRSTSSVRLEYSSPVLHRLRRAAAQARDGLGGALPRAASAEGGERAHHRADAAGLHRAARCVQRRRRRSQVTPSLAHPSHTLSLTRSLSHSALCCVWAHSGGAGAHRTRRHRCDVAGWDPCAIRAPARCTTSSTTRPTRRTRRSSTAGSSVSRTRRTRRRRW